MANVYITNVNSEKIKIFKANRYVRIIKMDMYFVFCDLSKEIAIFVFQLLLDRIGFGNTRTATFSKCEMFQVWEPWWFIHPGEQRSLVNHDTFDVFGECIRVNLIKCAGLCSNETHGCRDHAQWNTIAPPEIVVDFNQAIGE